MAATAQHRRPALIEIAGVGLRVVLVALACGALATLVALLAGCAGMTPGSIVEPPAVARPADAPPPPRSGAIYADASHRPLFEDRRARFVGDTLVITIAEKTSAGKNAGASASKEGSADVSMSTGLVPFDLEASSGLNNSEKAAANAANNFTGTVTAIVTGVLPNGNLKVRGEKQVALDRGTEFIRFSGIVNPTTINNNTVSSTAVADMRVEYRTNNRFDAASLQTALARFFFSILPL